MSDEQKSTKPTFTTLTPPERSRKYIFPTGDVVFKDVLAVAVSPSGTHRLELGGMGAVGAARKVIVPTGWIAIVIDVDDWTF
jgi:hypothetical protein